MRFFYLTLFLVVAAAPCLAADFATDAKAWYDQHTAVFEEAAKLSAEGYPAAGNEMLVTLADEDGSPLAAYMVANILYDSDPAASYRLHLRAFQAWPQEPAVTLEAALEQHRRGEYAAAVFNYRHVLATGKGPQYSALLADCLVRTGRLKEAVEAWSQAHHPTYHAAIDAAICSIYGPLAPIQRRGDLIAKIEAGDLTKFTDLILLDLTFDTDWWSAKVYDEGLDQDLKRASQSLGRKDPRYQALALYAKLARRNEKKPAEVQQALLEAKLVIGPDAGLPADSRIARALCELAVTAKLTTPANLWAAYETTLRTRLETQDRDALHLLCWLAAANRNPVLGSLNQLGWEEWNDTAFAGSFMIDLFRDKKLTSPDDSQLMAALAVSPDNATLCKLRIALAGENVTNEMIVAAIKAEYRKLSVNAGVRDSTTLNDLFDALGKRL